MREYRMKNNRGFSLVELTVLLGMVAVMAAISIPMLSSAMRDMQLTADARSIATTLTYARTSAASQLTRYRMSFDLDTNEWTLTKRSRTSGVYEIEQDTNALSRGIAESGIAFKTNSSSAPQGFPTTSSTVITFDSRGIPMEGAGIIYLSSAEIDYAVSVSLAGKVQFWRYRDNQWITQ